MRKSEKKWIVRSWFFPIFKYLLLSQINKYSVSSYSINKDNFLVFFKYSVFLVLHSNVNTEGKIKFITVTYDRQGNKLKNICTSPLLLEGWSRHCWGQGKCGSHCSKVTCRSLQCWPRLGRWNRNGRPELGLIQNWARPISILFNIKHTIGGNIYKGAPAI